MTQPAPRASPPMTRHAVIDAYFMEHRGKLLDLAAFLDRVDRAGPAPSAEDFRLAALRACLDILADGRPERARRVLERLSDPTTEPIPAAGVKGAAGAFPAPAAETGAGTGGRP